MRPTTFITFYILHVLSATEVRRTVANQQNIQCKLSAVEHIH